jgi:hypothetical protein
MLLLAGPLADGVIERTAERFELCFKVEAFFAGISRRLFDRVAVLAGFIALLPFLDECSWFLEMRFVWSERSSCALFRGIFNGAGCQYWAYCFRGLNGLEYSDNRLLAMCAFEEQLEGDRFGICKLAVSGAAEADIGQAGSNIL